MNDHSALLCVLQHGKSRGSIDLKGFRGQDVLSSIHDLFDDFRSSHGTRHQKNGLNLWVGEQRGHVIMGFHLVPGGHGVCFFLVSLADRSEAKIGGRASRN